MKPTKMTAVQSTMREVWVKALRERSLTIRFAREGEARQIRTLLYSLRKSVQMGSWADDAELCEAVDNCVIRCEWMTTQAKRERASAGGVEAFPFHLTLEHASLNSMFQSVFAALGQDAGCTPEESSAAASARRVQQLIEEAEAEPEVAGGGADAFLTSPVAVGDAAKNPYF